MATSDILMVVGLARQGLSLMEDYQKGKITEDELEQMWNQIKSEVQSANQLWENAGR